MASRWIDVEIVNSDPIDLGLDDSGRIQFGVNVLVTRTNGTDFDDEIESVLVAAGMTASLIFKASKAVLPKDGTCLQIHVTGGPTGLRTHNDTSGPTYRRSTAQLIARAITKPAAQTLAEQAIAALSPVKDQSIT